MTDDRAGRDTQARDAEKRQRERGDADEDEPTREEGRDDDPGARPTCHRRGCSEPASFVVLERYQEETGKGPVEAEASLCRDHTDEESPTNLENAYDDYVFRVEPLVWPPSQRDHRRRS